MLQCRKVVYKQRIRLKEFFVDFDKVWQRQAPRMSVLDSCQAKC